MTLPAFVIGNSLDVDRLKWVPHQPVAGITFRPAAAADKEQLYAACYAEQTAAKFAAMFGRSLKRQTLGRAVHLLALDGETVVGSAQLIQQGQRGEIAGVLVTAARRGEGIGTAMIGLLERAAAERGWRPVEIGVTVENVRARALYERLGYQVDREIPLEGKRRAVILRKA